jgi:hypothetical protein
VGLDPLPPCGRQSAGAELLSIILLVISMILIGIILGLVSVGPDRSFDGPRCAWIVL